MEKITINLKDKSKKELLLAILKELKFVSVEHQFHRTRTGLVNHNKVFAIWKKRHISLTDLRSSAWGRKN